MRSVLLFLLEMRGLLSSFCNLHISTECLSYLKFFISFYINAMWGRDSASQEQLSYFTVCTYQRLARGSTPGTPLGLRPFLLGVCIQKWIRPGDPGQYFLTKTVLIPSPCGTLQSYIDIFQMVLKLRKYSPCLTKSPNVSALTASFSFPSRNIPNFK